MVFCVEDQCFTQWLPKAAPPFAQKRNKDVLGVAFKPFMVEADGEAEAPAGEVAAGRPPRRRRPPPSPSVVTGGDGE